MSFRQGRPAREAPEAINQEQGKAEMSGRDIAAEGRAQVGIALIRVVVGIVFIAHGWQKLTVMGFDGVAGFFGTLGVPLPGVAAVVVTLLELVGGVLLLAGLFTRWIALPLAATMVVAILTVHLPNGFTGQGGYEFTLVLLASLLGLALTGAGAFSADAALAKKRGQVEARRSGLVTA